MASQEPQIDPISRSPAEWHATEKSKNLLARRKLGGIETLISIDAFGDWRTPATDYWSLLIPIYGPVRAEIDFGLGRFCDGDVELGMVLSTAGVEHRYRIETRHQSLAICMPVGLSRAMLAEEGLDIADFGPLHGGFWRDERIRQSALNLWRMNDGSSCAFEEAHRSLLMALWRRARGRPSRHVDARLSPHARRRVGEYIEGNLDGDCSINALARFVGLSPYHFARMFRAEFGEPPHRFVTRRRLGRAAELLRQTRDPIAAIALDCGFANQQRITEAFRRELGVTPAALRRQWRS